jgi:hypothetical protein
MEIEQEEISLATNLYDDPILIKERLEEIANSVEFVNSSKIATIPSLTFSGRLLSFVEMVSKSNQPYTRLFLWKKDCNSDTFRRILEAFKNTVVEEKFRTRGFTIAVWGPLDESVRKELKAGAVVSFQQVQDVSLYNNSILQGKSQWARIKFR